jgi:hypothetical protein
MTLDHTEELDRLKYRIDRASITLIDALPYCKSNLILWAAVMRALTELGVRHVDESPKGGYT